MRFIGGAFSFQRSAFSFFRRLIANRIHKKNPEAVLASGLHDFHEKRRKPYGRTFPIIIMSTIAPTASIRRPINLGSSLNIVRLGLLQQMNP
jgi:hypothetical protein